MSVKIVYRPSHIEVYAVTREQLELISRGAASDWKPRWQNSFSILLTCIINIIALGWDMKRQRSRLNEILKQPIQNVSLREEKIKSNE